MAHHKPPFTLTTAHEKVKAAQNLWNTRNPSLVKNAYTPTSIWRNRAIFLQGRDQIEAFLTAKWNREKDYRLRKELFCFDGTGRGNKIAVQFWYEYRDAEDAMKWKRCYGIEHWTFDEEGKMERRMMSGNDVVLGKDGDGVGEEESGRWFREGVDVDAVELPRGHY